MNVKEIIKSKKFLISLAIFLIVVLILFFAVFIYYFLFDHELGDGYYSKAGELYYDQKLLSRDRKNFKLLGDGFAENNNILYYYGSGFSSDGGYYKFLNNNYLLTSDSIYRLDDEKNLKRIRSVDGKTFEFVGNNYGRDKELYYFIGSQYSNNFTCVRPEFINDNEEYDIKCGDSFFKQGRFVKYTDQYQKQIETERRSKEFEEAYSLENHTTEIEEIIGRKLSIHEYQSLNIPNIICGKNRKEVIENSEKRILQINDKNFNAEYYCLKFNKKCDEIENQKNQATEELNKNIYNIVNGCLYKNNDLALEHNLRIKILTDYFQNDENNKNDKYWEGLEEAFRFEQDDMLYIYLTGYGGCGGCVSSGPYLKINKITGEVSGGYSSFQYLPDLFISPYGPIAIEVSFRREEDKGSINLYVFDFIKDKRIKLIYTVPQDKTILTVGDGTYPIDDSIKWLDKNTIQVQQYEKSQEEWVEAIPVYEENDGKSYYAGFKNPDEPIILEIN